MGGQHVRVERDGPITTITLDRPERRNAMSLALLVELDAALADVGASDARGVVLAAAGPVFSSGHDLRDLVGADLPAVRHLFATCTRLLARLREIPQPVVAKVHALATAAGCQLVASCDLAVAAESARFGIPGGQTGFFCHTPLVAVARNVGRKRALEMAFTGDLIDARTAAEWGLVNRAVPDAQLDEATLDLVTRATRGSALSKGLGKQGFYAQVDLDEARAYDYAVERMAAAARLEDAQEYFCAFLEKREPVYRDR